MAKRRTEVGFADSPDKFEAALASVDASIRKLAEAVNAAPDGGGINTQWRAEFASFVRRWELERDQYAPWTARLLLAVPNHRLQLFKDAYLWWARDFQAKSGKQPAKKAAVEPETLSASMLPEGSGVWLGAALLIAVVLIAARR